MIAHPGSWEQLGKEETAVQREAFCQALAQRPWIAEGGMGTQLLAAGHQPGACGELLNRDDPNLVAGVHHAYYTAGARLAITNTFGGSPLALARHGLSDEVEALNRAGVELARVGVGDDALVFGDIGPFGDFLEPLGQTTAEQLDEALRVQVEAIKAGGADGIIVETMTDSNELSAAVRAARAAGDWPVIASYAFDPTGESQFHTMMGTGPADAVRAALDAGADVVGANCGSALTLSQYVTLAEQLIAAADGAPVMVQPNAGQPEATADGLRYPVTPQEFAEHAPMLVDVGVRIIGGCCGTNAEHIRALHEKLGQGKA